MIATIPNEKIRVEYIGRVIEIYGDNPITVEQAFREADRLYYLENMDFLNLWKENKENNI